jgi:hypothetical protein
VQGNFLERGADPEGLHADENAAAAQPVEAVVRLALGAVLVAVEVAHSVAVQVNCHQPQVRIGVLLVEALAVLADLQDCLPVVFF